MDPGRLSFAIQFYCDQNLIQNLIMSSKVDTLPFFLQKFLFCFPLPENPIFEYQGSLISVAHSADGARSAIRLSLNLCNPRCTPQVRDDPQRIHSTNKNTLPKPNRPWVPWLAIWFVSQSIFELLSNMRPFCANKFVQLHTNQPWIFSRSVLHRLWILLLILYKVKDIHHWWLSSAISAINRPDRPVPSPLMPLCRPDPTAASPHLLDLANSDRQIGRTGKS